MDKDKMKKLYSHLPDTPGVYLMKNARGKIIYIGKAVNLKRRVSSYFTRPHDTRIEQLVADIRKIDHKNTETALEALILEAALIKKHQPYYNIVQKDDKSFLCVEFTDEPFPRVLVERSRTPVKGRRFGPFISGADIREGLRILRRIFPYSTHEANYAPGTAPANARACFDSHIGLCPGTCVGAISKQEYRKSIRRLMLFFQGKKKEVIKDIEKEMRSASVAQRYEKAADLKRKLFALQHIQDSSLITHPDILREREVFTPRIEGYDISNISGTSSVGSMVVFSGTKPDKSQYRKFRIRREGGADDYAMLAEVVSRRLNHPEWPLPEIMLIDGGAGQVHAVRKVLRERGVRTPVVGIAKGPERKRNDIIGAVPHTVDVHTLIRVRDEAHRFAISYHKKLRGRSMFD
jgi:excinuclease ABC subunit C